MVVAGAAQYLQRQAVPDSHSGGSSFLAAPFVAVGNAVGWAKAKLSGALQTYQSVLLLAVIGLMSSIWRYPESATLQGACVISR